MTSRDTTFTVPLFFETGVKKKRKNYLNLNLYRNMPFHLNNQLKKMMKEHIKSLNIQEKFDVYQLEYTVFLPDNRLRDISNICCVVDKYTADALVEEGVVPEDNFQYLQRIYYYFGGVDKEDPRCEVRIIEGL
jgi:hypothetical protein